jgi:DHA1 family multidrug resistance protein-like MFS transporter
MISGVGLIILAVGLPETFADNILLRRAARLRKLTGNNRLRSHSEIADAERSFAAIMKEALFRPLLMTFVEPIIIAINLYIGLIYAILYSYFESFPLVFGPLPGAYGWNWGVAGLPFLALTIGAMISFVVYAIWAYRVWEPQYVAAKGRLAPEAYLPLSQWGAFCYPICLFWFAWSANRTHWIVPVLASGVFGLADCWSFMPFLSYLTVAYPQYVASAQASNDFVRSMMGAAMPIVARPLFNNLGVDWGNSLLGFLTVLFVPIPFILIRYGPALRARSRMATKYATGLDEDDVVPEAKPEA